MKNKKIDTQALILCGGLGTRFKSVSSTFPKSLASVSGKPILKWLIDDLVTMGISQIILCTGHMSKKIETFIKGDYSDICIVSRENTQLGTGGAIKNAEKFIKSKQILILNGDSRIKFSFKLLLENHIKKNADLSILVSSKTNGPEYGSIKFDNNFQVVDFKEKSKDEFHHYTNAGVYCMNKKLLKELKQNKIYSLENDLIPIWVNRKNIFGFLVERPFLDIGTPERFKRAKFE